MLVHFGTTYSTTATKTTRSALALKSLSLRNMKDYETFQIQNPRSSQGDTIKPKLTIIISDIKHHLSAHS